MQKKSSRMEEQLASGNYEKPASISEGINDAMEAVIKKYVSRYGPKKIGQAI